ncbi:MAG: hypothetical protein ACLT0Y_08800 [Christensenellales bacterium]
MQISQVVYSAACRGGRYALYSLVSLISVAMIRPLCGCVVLSGDQLFGLDRLAIDQFMFFDDGALAMALDAIRI